MGNFSEKHIIDEVKELYVDDPRHPINSEPVYDYVQMTVTYQDGTIEDIPEPRFNPFNHRNHPGRVRSRSENERYLQSMGNTGMTGSDDIK